MHNSPFEKFRQNQKIWMAILAIVAMISFVVLPALMKSESGPTGGDNQMNQVVVTTKYGPLTEGELRREMNDRLLTGRFLANIEQAKLTKVITEIKDPTIQQEAVTRSRDFRIRNTA